MEVRRFIALVVFVAVLAAALGAALAAAGAAEAAVPGKVLWKRQMSTVYGRDDSAQDMAVAADGTVFVLCRVRWGDNGDDTAIGLTKYSRAGAKLWQRTFRTSGGLNDAPVTLALDAKGNAYVVGSTTRASGFWEGVLIRYTAGGKRSWVHRFANAAGGQSFSDVACDAAGNVVVCGREYVSATSANLLVREYGSGGGIKWTRRYGPSDAASDGARALAIDPKTRAVYVTGQFTTTVVAPDPSSMDVVVLKYSAAGRRLWAKTWGSAGAFDDSPTALVLGPTGEVYVAAVSHTSMWGHPAVLNFGVGGRLHWSDADADKLPQPGLNQISAIGVDGSDRVRILMDEPPGTSPISLRLYGADGIVRWQRELAVGTSVRRGGDDMAVTRSGKTYVAGFRFAGMGAPQELFVAAVKADGTGNLWATFRTGPDNSDANASHVAFRDGRLFASGIVNGIETGLDVLTLRLQP